MGTISHLYNHEAEASVLGALFADAEANLPVAQEFLTSKMFHLVKHRIVFEAVEKGYAQGKSIDPVSVADLLGPDKLKQVGGTEYLIWLRDQNPLGTGCAEHAQLVLDKARRRKLVETLKEIEGDLASATETDAVLDQAEGRIFRIAMESQEASTFKHASNTLTEGNLAAMIQKKKGIKTGYKQLDRMLGDLQPGSLYLLAARPAQGKSALAHNIAANVSKAGTPVAVSSLEMTSDQILLRIISREGNVDVGVFQAEVSAGRANPETDSRMARIKKAAQDIKSWPLSISDGLQSTTRALRASLRRWVRENGKGLIIIDYLQLMNGEGSSENRNQEVSQISRELVKLARELDCPILALSQLSREAEKSPGARPGLAHLRDSGSLEQDAVAVMFIYRKETYFGPVDKDGMSLRGKAEVIVAKNRYGSTGTVDMLFEGNLSKFTEVALEYENNGQPAPF